MSEERNYIVHARYSSMDNLVPTRWAFIAYLPTTPPRLLRKDEVVGPAVVPLHNASQLPQNWDIERPRHLIDSYLAPCYFPPTCEICREITLVRENKHPVPTGINKHHIDKGVLVHCRAFYGCKICVFLTTHCDIKVVPLGFKLGDDGVAFGPQAEALHNYRRRRRSSKLPSTWFYESYIQRFLDTDEEWFGMIQPFLDTDTAPTIVVQPYRTTQGQRHLVDKRLINCYPNGCEICLILADCDNHVVMEEHNQRQHIVASTAFCFNRRPIAVKCCSPECGICLFVEREMMRRIVKKLKLF